MILLLGSSGYIGSAFKRALEERGTQFQTVSHADLDCTNFDAMAVYLREHLPDFVINAAGYVGVPNVDACETARAETIMGNLLLPKTVAHACASFGIPWGHVSSGCIYQGASVKGTVFKTAMTTEGLQEVDNCGYLVRGFKETDFPNFTFRSPPCSFYSGVKAMAEEALAPEKQCYIWRTRIPFDEFDSPRNYLSKLQSFPRYFRNGNSLSHRGDFVRACLDLWESRAPFGTYNLTNPGWMRSEDIVEKIKRHLCPWRVFESFPDNASYEATLKTPRSACVLDVNKALAQGVQLRPVEAAVEDALKRWKTSAPA